MESLQGNIILDDILPELDFAFQPIIDAASGRIYGYEALLRNCDRIGFESVFALLDYAVKYRSLYKLDLYLRRLALERFLKLPGARKRRLFYNLDNRLLEMPDYRPGNTHRVLEEFGLPASTMVFEISERHQFQSIDHIKSMIATYRQQGYRIAVDDYGVGFSGLQMIYSVEPDIVKLDRFFIRGVDSDPRKRLFLQNVIQLSHLMGGLVVAEGVETEAEYRACVRAGCDLIQGYFVGRPLSVEEWNRQADFTNAGLPDVHQDSTISFLMPGLEIQHIEPVRPGMSFSQIIELFKRNPDYALFPVLNEYDEPVGLLHESSLKSLTYSPYGKDLLQNRDMESFLSQHIRKCYVADMHSSADELLKIFSMQDALKSRDGILITDGGRYCGFLSSMSMLRYFYRERIEMARKENPLTGLPGNLAIQRYLKDAEQWLDPVIIVYLDLDHFKPFNDRYGFQKGDLALMSIGESLKHLAAGSSTIFAGHVGGDDFFLGFRRYSLRSVCREIRHLQRSFEITRNSLLDPEDVMRGYIEAKNRYGQMQRFPLPSISAAVLCFLKGRIPFSDISGLLAEVKGQAKGARRGIAIRTCGTTAEFSSLTGR
jgi:diguanylate cyclase (GGDEF)-like protein